MNPVFIFGCHRSGTTLLGSQLGSNRDCVCIPEFPSKFIPARQKQDMRQELKVLLREVSSHWRFKLWDFPLNINRAPIDSFNDEISRLLEWIISQFAEAQGRQKATYWIDHTPENLNYLVYLNELFPEAKFIHLVRDGRAVFASTKNLSWGPCTGIGAAKYWNKKIAAGMAAETYLASVKSKCTRVRYEDLIEHPAKTLQGICNFLGLKFQDEMKTGKGFKVPNYTKRQHALVGKKPDPTRINGWKEALSMREVAIFEYDAGALLEYLRYERCFGQDTKGPTISESILSAIKERIKTVFKQNIIIKKAKKKYRC